MKQNAMNFIYLCEIDNYIVMFNPIYRKNRKELIWVFVSNALSILRTEVLKRMNDDEVQRGGRDKADKSAYARAGDACQLCNFLRNVGQRKEQIWL